MKRKQNKCKAKAGVAGNPRTTCDSAPPIRESTVKPGATQSAYYKSTKVQKIKEITPVDYRARLLADHGFMVQFHRLWYVFMVQRLLAY